MAESDQAQPPRTPAEPRRLTREQNIAPWADLMDACEAFLLAGLRRKIGPDGDLNAAHREWYERQMEEHDRMTIRLMEAFARRSPDHGQ